MKKIAWLIPANMITDIAVGQNHHGLPYRSARSKARVVKSAHFVYRRQRFRFGTGCCNNMQRPVPAAPRCGIHLGRVPENISSRLTEPAYAFFNSERIAWGAEFACAMAATEACSNT